MSIAADEKPMESAEIDRHLTGFFAQTMPDQFELKKSRPIILDAGTT